MDSMWYGIWEWQSKTEKAPLVSGWSVDFPTFITQTPPKMSKSWFQNHKGVSSTTYILQFSASYQHIIQFFTNGNSTATNYRVKLEICVEHIMCAWHTWILPTFFAGHCRLSLLSGPQPALCHVYPLSYHGHIPLPPEGATHHFEYLGWQWCWACTICRD